MSVTVGAKVHPANPPVALANEAVALHRISAPQRPVAFIQTGVVIPVCGCQVLVILLKQSTYYRHHNNKETKTTSHLTDNSPDTCIPSTP